MFIYMKKHKLKEIAREIRKDIVRMAAHANASHSGSALSPVEIITALYFKLMRYNPKRPVWPDRDRFILSKGHGGAVLYATLARAGYFSMGQLKTFCLDRGVLTTHPFLGGVPGVEATTGSLGHGLGLGIGMALAARVDKKKYWTFVVLSDGECDEGSNWEAILYAGFHKMDNLIIFIDYNKIQSFGRTKQVLDLEPFAEKFKAFRWDVQEINGHDFDEIITAVYRAKKKRGKPHCIIAHTVKGKGVSYMEDRLEWHYRAPLGDLEKKALVELDGENI